MWGRLVYVGTGAFARPAKRSEASRDNCSRCPVGFSRSITLHQAISTIVVLAFDSKATP